jgi:hypothetical protein
MVFSSFSVLEEEEESLEAIVADELNQSNSSSFVVSIFFVFGAPPREDVMGGTGKVKIGS